MQPANGLAALQPANGQDLSQQEVSINACRRGLYVESFFIVVWIISGVFEWQSVPVTLLSLLVEESCFLSVSFFFSFRRTVVLYCMTCFAFGIVGFPSFWFASDLINDFSCLSWVLFNCSKFKRIIVQRNGAKQSR